MGNIYIYIRKRQDHTNSSLFHTSPESGVKDKQGEKNPPCGPAVYERQTGGEVPRWPCCSAPGWATWTWALARTGSVGPAVWALLHSRASEIRAI